MNNMLRLGYEKSRKAKEALQKRLWGYIGASSLSLREKVILFFEMQRGMARTKYGWLLEGEKDATPRKTKPERKRGKESSMEGWQTYRQGRVCFNLASKTSKLGLSWLRSRTPFGSRRKDRALFIGNGSGSPQEWDQVRQSSREFGVIGKYITTYAYRVGARSI